MHKKINLQISDSESSSLDSQYRYCTPPGVFLPVHVWPTFTAQNSSKFVIENNTPAIGISGLTRRKRVTQIVSRSLRRLL